MATTDEPDSPPPPRHMSASTDPTDPSRRLVICLAITTCFGGTLYAYHHARKTTRHKIAKVRTAREDADAYQPAAPGR